MIPTTAAILAASTIVGRRLFTQHHKEKLFQDEHALHALESNASVLYINSDPLTLQWVLSTFVVAYVVFFIVGLFYEFISVNEKFEIQRNYLINIGPPTGCDPEKELPWWHYGGANTDECIAWTIKTKQSTINYGTVF